MADNNLIGTIPSSIYNISTLTMFSVTKNNLEGSLPTDVFNLANLQELYMGVNRLSGAIPISLSNASQLQLISFTENKFTGKVPWELGRLVNLSWIGLDENMLGTEEGNDLNFISHLTNCTKLERLLISENVLKGTLPNSIGNLSIHIKYLSLGINQIYGTLPLEIGNLINLNYLDMQYLMLTGHVPSSIGTLQKLQRLYIQGNKLTGPIPTSFGNLTDLYDLFLGQNNLSGNIPPCLNYSQKLQMLDLSQNDLTGHIPPSIFSLRSTLFINLSCNCLSGSFLREAVDLKQLGSLDVSKNRLSGGISSTIGSFVSLVSLHMNGNLFNGSIPQALQSLRGLDELDLSQNNLSGVIPDYLGELPFLKNLNLSFNDLEGLVPTTGVFKNISVISLVGNKKLCGGISKLKLQACTVKASQKGRTSFALKVLIPIIAVSICLTLLAGFVIIRYKRTKPKKKPSASFNPELMKISYRELLRATDNFCNANLLGTGSYGSVYKGILHQSETIIAVKVLNLHQRGASRSFVSECKAMKRIRHRNLLKILSVCSSVDYHGNEFRALIYEFMPNGNLENWLHPNQGGERGNQRESLSLIQRLNIAIDIAYALEYLQNHCQTQIIHGDLKPSNILLDENMVAHVGDFGLAKVLSNITSGSLEDQSSSVIIKGSIGYVAPEYGMGEPVSPSGDTYSYGILLLELFTGRRPTDDIFKEGLNIHRLTRMALPDHVIDIVDLKMMQVQQPEEMTERTWDCLIQLLQVGLSCSTESPRERMAIGEVVRKLHWIKNLY